MLKSERYFRVLLHIQTGEGKLVASGYLNGEITRLLDRFPQIDPHGREYTLRLVNAGTTLRQEDQTSWWDVDYAMYTQADNGEELMLVYIDITRVILSNGEVWDWDDAHYRIADCRNTFFAMMQTFQGMPYLHVVREYDATALP